MNQPLRIDHDRGADAPLIDMILHRGGQPHIKKVDAHNWHVDLPADVYVSVTVGDTIPGRSLPHYTVRTYRNRADRATELT